MTIQTIVKPKIQVQDLTKEILLEKMLTSDLWLIKSLLIVYANQTQDEQRTESVNHNNGIGFTGTDAKFLSSLANQVQKGIHYGNKDITLTLSSRQIISLRKCMMKYASQVLRTVKGRA